MKPNFLFIFLFTLLSSASLRAEVTFKTNFELTSQENKRIKLDDFRGKYKLVFFGFTHCPSVCPTSLSTLGRVLDGLEGDSKKVQVLFISVDPERDSLKRLKDYLKNFHSEILGLSGTAKELEPILRGYRAYAQKIPSPESKFYLMDHSDLIYLLDKDGHYLNYFSSPDGAPKIISYLKKIL